MKAAQLDDRRRLVMPPECPPNSAVVIQQVDEDTWVVKRQRPMKDIVILTFPVINRLPADPEWDKVEAAFVKHACRNLPEPEE